MSLCFCFWFAVHRHQPWASASSLRSRVNFHCWPPARGKTPLSATMWQSSVEFAKYTTPSPGTKVGTLGLTDAARRTRRRLRIHAHWGGPYCRSGGDRGGGERGDGERAAGRGAVTSAAAAEVEAEAGAAEAEAAAAAAATAAAAVRAAPAAMAVSTKWARLDNFRSADPPHRERQDTKDACRHARLVAEHCALGGKVPESHVLHAAHLLRGALLVAEQARPDALLDEVDVRLGIHPRPAWQDPEDSSEVPDRWLLRREHEGPVHDLQPREVLGACRSGRRR